MPGVGAGALNLSISSTALPISIVMTRFQTVSDCKKAKFLIGWCGFEVL